MKQNYKADLRENHFLSAKSGSLICQRVSARDNILDKQCKVNIHTHLLIDSVQNAIFLIDAEKKTEDIYAVNAL